MRFTSSIAVSLFIVLVACSSDDPKQQSSLANDGTRAVPCNSATCKGDDYCCGSTGWGDATCAAACGEKHALFCNDASDCPEGSVCCFTLEGGNSVVGSQCLSVCPFEDDKGQLCSTETKDCLDGTCTAIPVAPSGLSQCVKN